MLVGRCTYVGALHACIGDFGAAIHVVGGFFRDVRALLGTPLTIYPGSVFIVRKLCCTFTFESKENF